MSLLIIAFVLLGAGALSAPLFSGPRTRLLGPAAAVSGALPAAAAALAVLCTGEAWDIARVWQMPLGTLHIGMDPLSAVFVLLVAVIGAAGAVYGHGYMEVRSVERKVRLSWSGYNCLIAAMLLVLVARDAFLFLVAWEAMALSSFFLVIYESEKGPVIKAGWIYLIATHIGTAFLLVMFLLLGKGDSLSFSALSASGTTASVVFLLALVGFGAKAGLVPMHIWLPEAHPAAPSHVSALMSGVMIKTGVYGLLRVLTLLSDAQIWWAWVLVGIGTVSGVLGILMALAQHDLKRLLACCSVENVGIITIGVGIGLLGIQIGNSLVATLGLCGALLHVINHGVFKSLLFFGAGSVLKATGTREIERLGGLIKKMPTTAIAFIIGAAAICGLPPFNGFVSEFMIYVAAFTGVGTATMLWNALLVIVSLSLMGGLAAVCFTKACSVVFLGEPRSDVAKNAAATPAVMRWTMLFLAALCAVLGIAAPAMVGLISPAVLQLLPDALNLGTPVLVQGLALRISLAALILMGLTGLIVFMRSRLLADRTIRRSVTWDCGYVAPSPRMQYTASAFIQPVMVIFRLALRSRKSLEPPEGYFPRQGSLSTRTPDLFIESVYVPALNGVTRLALNFSRLIAGRTHLYILYIVLTLIVLLVWGFW